jgi:aliphatic nitrilase
MSSLPKVKVAAAHVAPVFLDKAGTTEKAIAVIKEAAGRGAQVIAFPETFIPAFPVWAALWAPIYNHDLFERMVENSVSVDGPEIAAIAAAAKRHGVVVSMGISERGAVSTGLIWNSYVMLGEDGQVLNHHRKLVPTFYEKLIWAPGDGYGLRVAETRFGRIGGLICGENTNPLARFSLMAQQEQIHISSWPPMWPTRAPSSGGNFDNVAANRIRSSAHSFEAKAFGIVCASFMDKPMRDFLVNRDPSVAEVIDNTSRGVSMFIDPTGSQVGDTLQNEEGIAYAEFDLNKCIEPKQFHDVVGYYNRFDVFSFGVERRRHEPVAWTGDLVGQFPRVLREKNSSGSSTDE